MCELDREKGGGRDISGVKHSQHQTQRTEGGGNILEAI